MTKTPNIFIDGQSGTTGLQILRRLSERSDLNLLSIKESERKSTAFKQAIYDEADLVILCLPDDAAREAVSLSKTARFIDASTAHRTSPDWTYGLPELCVSQRDEITKSRLVSNPGCYPTGSILAIRPLIDEGFLDPDTPIRIHATSGYSGGGKNLISEYQQNDSPSWRVRPYSLELQHKHLPEMQQFAKLSKEPLFLPSVGHFYQGMLIQIPLFQSEFSRSISKRDIIQMLQDRYAKEPFVRVYNDSSALDNGFLSPTHCNDTNRVELMVFGNAEQVVIIARLANLGKGASGAAVQNLNLMLGISEKTGLIE